MNGFTRASSAVFALLLVSSLSVLSGVSPAQAPEFETAAAIANVTAIPRPGEKIDDATILFENGRITAVGTSVDVPAHARVFDGTGLYAYAGFIDAASHLGMADEAPSHEELDRITDDEQEVREGPRVAMQYANRKGVWPYRSVIDFFDADSEKIESYRKEGFTAALITPHPAILGGQGDVVLLDGKPLRRATLKPGVTQIVAFETGPVADSSDRRRYPTSKMGIVALLRQTYLDAEWYRQRRLQALEHPGAVPRVLHDPALDAMGALLDREQMWLFAADSPNEIHHALDLAKELDQRIAILGGDEAYKVADRLARENVPVIASLDFDEKPKLARKKPKEDEDEVTFATTKSWSPEWEDDFFEPLAARRDRIREWEEQVNNIHALFEAGVKVAVTQRGLKNPAEFWKKARIALEHELDEDVLLAALTVAPAEIYGVSRDLGEIEPGKAVNLTLLTGPLGDKDSKVQQVYVDGERFAFPVNGKSEKDEEEESESDAAEEGEEPDEETVSEEAEAEDSEEDAAPEDKYRWAIETDADREKPIDTGGKLLLRNATVLTVTRGTLEDTDILVRAGRIYDIGEDLAADADTQILDLTGYWVMPGIIDAHSHMAVTGINESSQSISSEVRQSDVVNHTQRSIHRALAGGVTTIHTMHGSANTMGGQNAVLKLKYNTSPREMLVTSGPRIVKFALGENVTRSRSIPRYPNTRMGVESVFRQAFTVAEDYERAWTDYERRASAGEIVAIPRRDLRLEAIRDIKRGGIWVHSHCYRADEILRLLAVAEDFGFRIACLQHVLEGYRVAPEIYAHGAGTSTFSDWWSYKKEAFDAIPYNAAMLSRQGIVTSLNSDSAKVVRYLNLEAAKTLRYGGLSAAEALRLITEYPARQIGLFSRIGSIEEGKDADFAIFDGHPLDTHAKNVLTIVEGEVFFAHRDLDLENLSAPERASSPPEPPGGLLEVPVDNAGAYAIVGGTVYPVAAAPIENGTVLIANGKIAAVGAEVNVPDGTAIVDAAGLRVYPGMVNAATQLGLVEISGISQTVDARELAQFQPDLKALSAINPHSEHIPVSLVEGVTTSHVLPGGGTISGRAALIQLSGWTLPELLRDGETGLVINLPSLPARLDGDERNKRIDEHRERIEDIEAFVEKAAHYIEVQSLPDVRVARNIRLGVMAPYLKGEKPVFFPANSYKDILEALRFAETFGFKPVIVGGAEAWKAAETLAEKNVAVILTEVMELPRDTYAPWDANYSTPARLEAAGVDFCIASSGAEFARQLPTHAGMAVAHGLSAERAVKAVTLDAARILGVDSEIGSLEPDKVADVIITSGDLTQAGARTLAAFIAGQPVKLESLHERNYEKFRGRPDPGLTPAKGLHGPPPMRQATGS